jgi:amidohydrolase
MASEDMSFYLQKVPGCFFFLGAGNPEKGLASPLHSSSFDFDESALATGATLLASLALAWLETQE